jgi:branched-chain amino acid transport system substrate-binding protein
MGGTVVGRDPYLPSLLESGTSLAPYLERAIRNGADALVIAGGDEVPDIIRDARRLGYRGAIMGTDGLIGMAQAGPVGEGVYVTSGFLPDRPTDAAQDFVRRYTERFGEAPRDGSAHAYDTVMLLAHAIREVGPNRHVLRDYIAGVGTVHPAYEGVTGTIRFDENGDVVGKDVSVGVVRDGRIVTLLASDSPELHH